ncbi:MAG: efflux RND transporter periplasmic adaptor subunit [Caldimonas sp.]
MIRPDFRTVSRTALVAGLSATLALVAVLATIRAQAADDAKATSAKPALSVVVTTPQRGALPLRVTANGNIAAWQEAIIGTEANGLRLAEVRVNVGDVVRRGQTLATFAPESVQSDLAQSRAAVAEAEATLAEAHANADRARSLRESGALSEATIASYVTAERTAKARLDAQRAGVQSRQLRVAQAAVLAPDNGVISSRSATVGAVLPAGQELFRMIRQNRLEWRAEVASSDLGLIQPGMKVKVTPASALASSGDAAIAGTVRIVAPTVDPQTRNGIVYVDLPHPGSARAGMFARGEFEVGSSSAMTLPQSAVQLRDGFSYVFKVGADARVTQVKITIGRRVGDRVEVTGGLEPQARVVLAGGGFLTEGDTVRVVEALPTAAKAAP